jgi:hypothetical protein
MQIFCGCVAYMLCLLKFELIGKEGEKREFSEMSQHAIVLDYCCYDQPSTAGSSCMKKTLMTQAETVGACLVRRIQILQSGVSSIQCDQNQPESSTKVRLILTVVSQNTMTAALHARSLMQ